MGILSKEKKDKGLKELVGVCPSCNADFDPADGIEECRKCGKPICPSCTLRVRFGPRCRPCHQEEVERIEQERIREKAKKREVERERQRISKQEWSTIGTHGWRVGIAKVHEKRKGGK